MCYNKSTLPQNGSRATSANAQVAQCTPIGAIIVPQNSFLIVRNVSYIRDSFVQTKWREQCFAKQRFFSKSRYKGFLMRRHHWEWLLKM